MPGSSYNPTTDTTTFDGTIQANSVGGAVESTEGSQAKVDTHKAADVSATVHPNASTHIGAAAPHAGHVNHSLATAINDFLVASGAGVFVKKTLAEVLTILGKGSASGIAPLDAASKVPTVNLGGAGASASNYLCGDQTWKTPAGGGESEIIVVATADTPNATVNLANATGLTFVADANSTYIIEVFLLWAASVATVGIKVSATASGSPTITAGQFITNATNGTPDSSSYNANDVTVTTSASAFTAYNCGILHAVLKTSGSTSTWQLRFAAETTGSITIKAGSVLRYRKVA